MNMDLWDFLSIAVIFSGLASIFGVYVKHQSSMKRMEIEALQLKNENVNEGSLRKLEERIEALEKIVTEKRQSLGDQISSL